MSTSGNIIYVNREVTPNEGLSISEVSTLLGETSLDLGTLCKSDNINLYAKFKPVRYSGSSSVAAIVVTKQNSPLYYRADAKDCGLNLTKLTYGNITLENVQAATNWKGVRKLPTGGSSSPYRLLDFDGYNHSSVCPVQITYPSVLYINDVTEGLSENIFFSAEWKKSSNVAASNSITPLDLMNYLTLTDAIKNDATTMGYIGILAFYNYGTYKRVGLLSKNYTGSGASDIEFTMENFPSALGISSTSFTQGSYLYLAPCICNYNTNGAWKDAAAEYNGLEVLLMPAENGEGAVKTYTLAKYTAPITPHFSVEWTVVGLATDSDGDYLNVRAAALITVTARIIRVNNDVFQGATAATFPTYMYPRMNHTMWNFNTHRVEETDYVDIWTPSDISDVQTGTITSGEYSGRIYAQKTFTLNVSSFKTGTASGSGRCAGSINLMIMNADGSEHTTGSTINSNFVEFSIRW